MKLDFFALRADFKDLLEFIWQETDCRIAESYSRYDQELRWFDFFEELDQSFPLGVDHRASKVSFSLMLWSRSVMPSFKIERITLDQRRAKGYTYRYSLNGTGLIQLSLGGLDGQVITPSGMGHISQKRARAYGCEEGVDWSALSKLGRKIDYHVRKRLAVANTVERSLPVLAEAYQKCAAGCELREGGGSPWKYELAGCGADA